MQSSKKRRNLVRSALVTTSTLATEAVIASFGNSALAEDGGYSGLVTLLVATNELCVPEGEAISVNSTNVTSNYPATGSLTGSPSPSQGGEDFYITELLLGDATNQVSPFDTFVLTPTPSTFNGYPGVPTLPAPGTATIQFGFSFTAPAVDFATGVAEYDADVTATAREYFTGGPWGTTEPDDKFDSNDIDQEFFTIRVEHKNSPPTVSTAPANFEETITDPIDFTTTATVNDVQGNEVNITFELSSDNFSTILQSATYSNVNLVPGVDFEQDHTFTQLGTGTFNWRVRVLETGSDLVGSCIGGPFEDPPVSLLSNQPVQVANMSGAMVEGYIFIDANLNGTFDVGEAIVPNVTVFITDSSGTNSVVSDSNGYFSDVVMPGQVTVQSDSTDPDIPANYSSSGPVTVTAVSGATASTEIPLTTLADSGSNFIPYIAVMLLGIVFSIFKVAQLSRATK